MSLIMGNTVTFGDGTVQGTGWCANYTLITSNTTYTIPAKSLKLTVIGGGGGGGWGQSANSQLYSIGGTGGSGAALQTYLQGLTVGSTLTITIGAGGAGGTTANASGSNGVATVVSSGTQTITTLTANGGFGGANTYATTVSLTGGSTSGTIGSQSGVIYYNLSKFVSGLVYGTANSAGVAGPFYGVGGSGGWANKIIAGYAGAAGNNGVVIIETY